MNVFSHITLISPIQNDSEGKICHPNTLGVSKKIIDTQAHKGGGENSFKGLPSTSFAEENVFMSKMGVKR